MYVANHLLDLIAFMIVLKSRLPLLVCTQAFRRFRFVSNDTHAQTFQIGMYSGNKQMWKDWGQKIPWNHFALPIGCRGCSAQADQWLVALVKYNGTRCN